MASRPGDKSRKQEFNPSVSELVPILRFVETKEWITKGSLLRISFVLASVILMEFALSQTPPWFEVYGLIVAAYLALESVHIIYKLCGIRKPFWWLFLLAAPIFFVCRYVATNPQALMDYSTFVARFTPGDVHECGSFFDRWAYNFFNAAVPEELFKISPVLLAFLIGRFLSSPWRERLGVWEPLDGVLLGSTCAMGFSAAETVYRVMLNCTSTGSLVLTADTAPLWAFPRGLSEVAGHAAYTGFLGYAIGLVVIRPRRRWFTLINGILIATLAHALWDATSSYSSGTSYIIALIEGIVFYALLAGAILKARQISPSRRWNFATDLVGSHVTHTQSATGETGANTGTSSAGFIGDQFAPASDAGQKPPGAKPGDSPPEALAAFNLYVSGKIVPLAEGRKVSVGEILGLTAQNDDGVVAEVVSSPKHPGAIGLKNRSKTAWKARLPQSAEEEVPPGKAIVIARGTVLIFWETRGEIL